MRFGYRPSRLLGAVHSGGNVVFSPDGNTLYSPVTNRVVVFDLIRHVSTMLPYEHAYPIRRVAVSPNGRFLLTVDTGGYLFLGHVSRGIILCRMRLKRPNKVRDLVFSPDGQFFAVTQDRQFQVWRTPGAAREFAPFVLHRTFGSHGDEILSLAWAPCGQYLLTGSKDLTVRIWSLHPLPPAVFTPATLSGHRDRIVGAFFSASGPVEARDPPLLSDGGAGSPPSLPPSLPPPSTPKGPDTVWTSPRSSPLSSLRIYSIARDGFLYAWVIDPSTQTWKCHDRHAFQKSRRAHVVSVCYHAISSPIPAAAATAPSPGTALLVVGFSDGVFGLYDLPTGAVVHTLSVSSGQIGTVALNLTGEWLALGCAPLGQLLVWEWQSETYVLKQQGHAQAVNAVAYSPDGQVMATGGEDAKVKLWSTASGFSFVTFTAHDAPVTALAFLGSGQAVLSASLDGTVRAHDLLRYRNFRTLTTPAPTQLLSLAVDPSGEVVCAGSSEPFEVYVWALQTGKLLDVLPGHGGPVVALDFSPTDPLLASGSWDGTVKVWNVYKKELIETHAHAADVLAVAFRPDGKELCVATLNGLLTCWDVAEGHEIRVLDGKRDLQGGRGHYDKISASAAAAAKHFTSLAYTADGSCLLAGGRSKFLCIYHLETKALVRKFQLSHDRSLDGVVDKLHSGKVGSDGLPLLGEDAGEDSGEDGGEDEALPGAKRGVDGSKRRLRAEVRVSCVRFSPTGREWAAATPQGLLVFGLEEDMQFNPMELDVAATPAAVREKIREGQVGMALVMAGQLNEESVLLEALDAAPPGWENLLLLTQALPPSLAPRLLALVAKHLPRSPHLSFLLSFSLALLHTHGKVLRQDPAKHAPHLRAMQRAILKFQEDVGKHVDSSTALLNLLMAGEGGREEWKEDGEGKT